MGFASLVGQPDLKVRLGSILKGEPGHAYILSGPLGIGKSAFAQVFAQALLCQDPTPDGGCGICDSCRHFSHQAHPDYRTLLLDPADKVIKVERVRQTIQADIALRPQFGRRKVYLVDADFLNEQGQNTLLKSLEEPPDFVTFILMASGLERLLPTVLSRLTVLPLQRYNDEDVIAILAREWQDSASPCLIQKALLSMPVMPMGYREQPSICLPVPGLPICGGRPSIFTIRSGLSAVSGC
jgi:DNA polymerase-3 subunit delta'